MYVQWLARHEKNSERTVIINDVEKLLDESMHSIREMSFSLSPHILQNFGLHEAINSFAGKIQQSSHIEFDVSAKDIVRFDEKIETIVYRVLCECINNSVKHSNATNISIELNCNNKVLYVKYKDNGKGFDVKKVMDEHKGIGLLNIQSRLKSVNGSIEIKSNENKGTSIKFSVNT